MNLNQLVGLLGHSHKDKVANKKLKELGFEILSPNENYIGVPFHISYNHSNLSIRLSFNGYNYFKNYFGEPKNYTEKKVDELILQAIFIDFDEMSSAIQEQSILPLKLELRACLNLTYWAKIAPFRLILCYKNSHLSR